LVFGSRRRVALDQVCAAVRVRTVLGRRGFEAVRIGYRASGSRVLIWVWDLRLLGRKFVALGRVDETSPKFAFGLADRPREVDVAVVVDVGDLDVHRVARVPV